MKGLQFSRWQPEMMSPNMTFNGMSISPRLVPSPNMATSKIESPVQTNEKSSALELAKNQDLPSPLPIPQGRRAPITSTFMYSFKSLSFCFCALNGSILYIYPCML